MHSSTTACVKESHLRRIKPSQEWQRMLTNLAMHAVVRAHYPQRIHGAYERNSGKKETHGQRTCVMKRRACFAQSRRRRDGTKCPHIQLYPRCPRGARYPQNIPGIAQKKHARTPAKMNAAPHQPIITAPNSAHIFPKYHLPKRLRTSHSRAFLRPPFQSPVFHKFSARCPAAHVF